jgi:hypothetical protein
MAKYTVEFAHLIEPSPTLKTAVILKRDKAIYDSELDCLVVQGFRIPISRVKEYKLSAAAVPSESATKAK